MRSHAIACSRMNTVVLLMGLTLMRHLHDRFIEYEVTRAVVTVGNKPPYADVELNCGVSVGGGELLEARW